MSRYLLCDKGLILRAVVVSSILSRLIVVSLFLVAAQVAAMDVKTAPNKQVVLPDEIVPKDAVVPGGDTDNADDLAQNAGAVRAKLLASGISEKDVAGVIAWARTPRE